VQAGLTFAGYDQGKIPASTLISAVPFGLDPVGYLAWWYAAGGEELGAELYRPHNVMPLLCAITGPETAGWFREPIDGVEDLRGLKIRFAGLGGSIMEQMGASVTMLPGGEIFQALEKGAIDATEFSLPVVDQALGFHRVARYNYYPGWHQPFTGSYLMINLDTWNQLSGFDQSLLRTACKSVALEMLAGTEAAQGAVIESFDEKGVQARTLSPEVLASLQQASAEVLERVASEDRMFEKILRSQQAFARQYGTWKRLGYLPPEFQ
jgi:TRAP-type mannitol/chloroaromatic compound transport system substrate-binding protein